MIYVITYCFVPVKRPDTRPPVVLDNILLMPISKSISAIGKQLGRKVTELYMNTGIYCEFTRQEKQVTIKKSKTFKQVNFLGGKTVVNDQVVMDFNMEPKRNENGAKME